VVLISLTQVKLGEHESELHEMNSNSEKLQQSYNELLEFKLVLSKVMSCQPNKKDFTDIFYFCFSFWSC
jgi:hypothetical protein